MTVSKGIRRVAVIGAGPSGLAATKYGYVIAEDGEPVALTGL